MVAKVTVGIIGVGNISPAYINGCRAFDILDLVACADLNIERAQAVAAEHNLRAMTVDELLADPAIQIVINLTIPAVHASVSQSILNAGKHVYSEKPLAVSLDDAKATMELARTKGLRVGCAPDTFLFAPHQTVRKLIDEGAVGKPIAAVGFMLGHGPESWHPNPDFFYAPGGGPMLDMGPYYVTCLVNLMGAVSRVSGAAVASFPERIAQDGRRIPVAVPTHYAGTLEFASGAVATLITSFDVWGNRLPQMEIYGETGSITVPDPNGYQPKNVDIYRPESREWQPQALVFEDEWKRGIGLADMAYAFQSGRPHRASGELAYHVLEVMTAFERAHQSGQYITIESRPEQPRALPLGLAPRTLDP
ncbi:MAG: Gfo/Idh/MocA family oxidoreductase [bacterium]|nr:Gfo/Idh/MocA family oxidoreductase [bacterium]